MIKFAASILFFVTFSISALAGSQWSHLNDDAFQMQVRIDNNFYTDLFGSPEFVYKVSVTPYDFNNEPLSEGFPLEYRKFMPISIPVNDVGYFSTYIKFQDIFNSLQIDLNKIAYFQIRYRVIEDDFYAGQTVASFIVRLTPFGIKTFSSKGQKSFYSNRVVLATSDQTKLSAAAEFSLGTAKSTLEKVRENSIELEQKVRKTMSEIKSKKR